MDITSFLTSAFALVFVMSLIWLTAIALRKYGSSGIINMKKKSGSRITIEDATVVDAKRKLILVRCDEKEHLILVGGEHDLLIESKKSSQDETN